MSRLDSPLKSELGARTATALEKHLQLTTVGQLLRHSPRRYVQRGELTPVTGLVEGEQVTVVADVKKVEQRVMRERGGAMVVATVGDASGGTLQLTFFCRDARSAAFRASQLPVDRRAMFAGKVARYKGQLQLVQPDVEDLEPETTDAEAAVRAKMLVPIYPATAKVTSWVLGTSIRTVLETLDEEAVPDPLPAELRERRGLPSLVQALRLVHAPVETSDWQLGKKRLRYEEALVLQLTLARRRAHLSGFPTHPYPARPDGLLAAFDARLPFELTAGQVAVGEAVRSDLARTQPMNRLLQGEVGSGKTVVALRAMLQVVDGGAQAALLAPTEVLAAQHHRSLTAALGDLASGGQLGGDARGTRVTLLTGSQNAAARRRALLETTTGEAGIVVGTHALIQDAVDFHDLGLVVVDEQHRFGVEQRDRLRAKSGVPPHVLVMTATPIPRTVAMTVFGDLDVSTLSELPAGRAPITTHVVPLENTRWVDRTWQRVREEVDAGRQAYVVAPKIGDTGDGGGEEPPPEDGSSTPPISATDVFEELGARPEMRGLRLALLHGRLPSDEKDAVMRSFAAGDVDVLVATTVIEVGVDVPNSTVMVIMDADRFGMSQLHQLRGRIGRGGHAGTCLLVTRTGDRDPRRARLDAVAATSDGFELSEIDLKARHEGDVLGADQSGGYSSLTELRVVRDEALIVQAREDATAVVAADPELVEHPGLLAALQALDDERRAYLDRG